MQQNEKPIISHEVASRDAARAPRQRRTDGDREAVAVPSNTATNNSINSLDIKYLRYGVDSLYLSYQGELFKDVDAKLSELKRLARSENPREQAKAQLKLGDHLFEVKDKGSSMFAYVLEDNAFRIQLSRPKKAVPMAYVKISANTSLIAHQRRQKPICVIYSVIGVQCSPLPMSVALISI